jgi:hypothetical protein
LHFNDNKNELHRTNENYDRLWKMRTIFGKFSDAYTKKYYSLTEHLAVEEIIVLYKG